MSDFIVVDATGTLPDRPKIELLPVEFAYDLGTIERARRWLTNPASWFKSELFIIKWVGLVPYICERHGRRLQLETWDDGLPWVVVTEQSQRRHKSKRGEVLDEPERLPAEE